MKTLLIWDGVVFLGLGCLWQRKDALNALVKIMLVVLGILTLVAVR